MSRHAHLIVMVMIPLSAFSQNRIPLRFDAAWWLKANSEQQQGFIYGYLDCRQPLRAPKASINEYQKAVSDDLRNKRSSEPNAIAKAIEHAAQTLKSRDTRGAENYPGPHGYLDGEWWGSFHGQAWPPDVTNADRGYVEGYLECSSASVLEDTVLRYQSRINRYFASGRHEHDKIADVLQHVRVSFTEQRSAK